MSYGLVQISGVIYAQFGSASGVASYLLALRLMQTISQFSQAPFYSKLPLLAKLRSEGNLEQQVNVAKRGMLLAYWTYLAGFIGLGVLATPLLRLIGRNVVFFCVSREVDKVDRQSEGSGRVQMCVGNRCICDVHEALYMCKPVLLHICTVANVYVDVCMCVYVDVCLRV